MADAISGVNSVDHDYFETEERNQHVGKHDNTTDVLHSSDTERCKLEIPYDLSNTDDAAFPGYTELRSQEDEFRPEDIAKCWEMNYHEAAIYLEEGENNDKLDYHPSSKDALPAYLIVHNHWFYALDLLSACILMALALMERPAVPHLHVSLGIHVSVELLALSVVAVELGMKLRWMGVKHFFLHRRTVFKMFVLCIMFVEALVVVIRQTTHFRVVRALRPLFLIDNHYLGGVRRLIRQILQSLPPIIDMLVMLFFFMAIFGVLGFYLFSKIGAASYFVTLFQSFLSLFVLLTTANNPDVMLPYYAQSKWSALFFVSFLIVHLYFLMNLVLAVVYERFSTIEKNKFRKLLLHRRKACQGAFNLLVTRSSSSCLKFVHFEGLMRYYKPKASRKDVYLMFKTLDIGNNCFLSQEEFLQVYEVSSLAWRIKRKEIPWFKDLPQPFRKILTDIHKLMTWKGTDFFIYLVIAASGTWQLIEAAKAIYTRSSDQPYSAHHHYYDDTFARWLSIGVASFYSVEMCLKILAFGVCQFFRSGWNKFDFVVTVASVAGIIGEYFNHGFFYVVILRTLKLLKLFQFKKRYQDVLGTAFILMPRFLSVGLVLFIVYYFFAIIGMEIFSEYNMMDCCKNTSVENYYVNGSIPGYYYLVNFGNMVNSYVTLFILMVVNNWFIIMNGYAVVTSEWSRAFFMIFYLITMVVLQIVVAFVLEAFIFRIQYKIKMGDMDKDNLVKVDMALSNQEARFCEMTSYSQPLEPSSHNSDDESTVIYRGTRWRTKFSFCLKMYADEVTEWLEQAEEEDRREALSRSIQSSDVPNTSRDDMRRTVTV